MPATPATRFLNPVGLPTAAGYSHAAEASGGRTVYIAGQVALDAGMEVVGMGDFEAQARQVFTNVATALSAAGLDFAHVVKLGMFVTDLTHLPTLRTVRDEFVDTAAPPASTLVQVAALVRPEFLVEVDAIAVGP